MPYAADLLVMFNKDKYFPVTEVIEVHWTPTPQCVLSDPVMCSYSLRETTVKSLYNRLDRQNNGEGRDSDCNNTYVTIQSESCTQPLTVNTQSQHHH